VNHFFWVVVLALAGSLVGVSSRAQPSVHPSPADPPGLVSPPTAISLRTALDAAWQRAVEARVAEAQIRRADADRSVARSPWASPPSLALSHRDDRFQGNAGRREVELGLAVPMWLPGQRSARADTAETMVLHAQFAEQVARLRLADEVQATAWQIVGIQTEARQAEVQVATLQQLADDVDRRVRAGDLARADSLIARAEWLAASSALGGIVQKLQAAQARWTLLTGLSTLPELAVVPAPDKDTADLTIHPEWQMAKQSSELARQRLKLLRSSRRDPPEMAVGVRQDMAGRGDAMQGSVVIGVRLPFSTDDRNRPLEAAALSDLEIARVREERLQQRLNSDLALARETQRAIQAQLDADRKGAQLLRERAALIQKSFLAGETPLPELLRVMATAAQAESAVARQTAALGLAGARLQQALGFLP